jgi:type VI secretion system protein
MLLTLRVLSYKGLPPVEPDVVALDRSGGSLGRSADNSLVLPDSERVVSKKHALIQYEKGCFLLTDTSSNGTMLLNKSQFVHKSTIALEHGDRLRIGDYELEVGISGLDEAQEYSSQSGVGLIPENEQPSGTATDSHELPGDWIKDLLHRPGPAPDAAEAEESGAFSPLGDYQGPPNISPPQQQPEPAFKTDSSNKLPEDWMNGFRRSAGPVPDSVTEVEIKTSLPLEAGAGIPKTSSLREAPVAGGAAEGPNELPGKWMEDFRTHPEPARDTPAMGRSEGPSDAARGGIVAESPQTFPSRQTLSQTDHELFACFAHGAGITDTSFIRGEEIPELMRTVGKVFREMIQGLMTILWGRRETKAQLRLTMTLLEAAENNPLKFSRTLEDALRMLLTTNQPGYLDAFSAVREGCRDIMNHDVAMKAGVQAALIEALKRFHPEQFETKFEEGIVFHRKAKCWTAYCEEYFRIFDEVLKGFFGSAFIQAYEEQMERSDMAHKSSLDAEQGTSDG